jgi:hypothetical protein
MRLLRSGRTERGTGGAAVANAPDINGPDWFSSLNQNSTNLNLT